MEIATESHMLFKNSSQRSAHRALWLVGYAYSVSIFLFACALALSYRGIAFTPLHLKIKAELTRTESPLQAIHVHKDREPAARSPKTKHLEVPSLETR